LPNEGNKIGLTIIQFLNPGPGVWTVGSPGLSEYFTHNFVLGTKQNGRRINK